MKLTNPEIRSVLTGAGLPAWAWQLPDESYETVSSGWAVENWRAWLAARPSELCVLQDFGGKRLRVRPLWLAESSDCDNLALGTTAHAQVGNALAAQMASGNRGGVAYGFFFYTAGPARAENFNIAGGHAINWFVDHGLRVQFFEPGQGVVVDLNPTERSSSWFGIAV